MGDRVAAIESACETLRHMDGIQLEQVSSLYETRPVGKTDQRDFINAAAQIATTLSARGLLESCLAIEASLGRMRNGRWGPRVIDIDLLVYNDTRIEEPGLAVPHPRLHERAFVLVPLAQIAPNVVPPGFAESVLEMAARLPDRSDVRIYNAMQ